MTKDEAEHLVASVPHWHHEFEIYPGVKTPGSYNPGFLWAMIKDARDWKGARTIDVGPADGALSKWTADEGANVTALDFRPKHTSGFGVMEHLSGHAFDFRVGNIFDAPEMGLGQFDAVLFLGVLYHLPDPLRGLWSCRKLCTPGSGLYLETWFQPNLAPGEPVVRYVPQGAGVDWTNFWSPNREALLAMIRDAGFDIVRNCAWGGRIFVEAIAIDDPERNRRMAFSYAANVQGR
jgi:tRNA (mo5U34)-methyltransferase